MTEIFKSASIGVVEAKTISIVDMDGTKEQLKGKEKFFKQARNPENKDYVVSFLASIIKNKVLSSLPERRAKIDLFEVAENVYTIMFARGFTANIPNKLWKNLEHKFN